MAIGENISSVIAIRSTHTQREDCKFNPLAKLRREKTEMKNKSENERENKREIRLGTNEGWGGGGANNNSFSDERGTAGGEGGDN